MRRHRISVVCPAGHQYEADLLRSANVTTFPVLKDEILTGRFNLTTCPTCLAESYADVPFLYHDMGTELRVWVYPDRERLNQDAIIERIRKAAAITNTLLPTDRRGPELVFGLGELTELIAGI